MLLLARLVKVNIPYIQECSIAEKVLAFYILLRG